MYILFNKSFREKWFRSSSKYDNIAFQDMIYTQPYLPHIYAPDSWILESTPTCYCMPLGINTYTNICGIAYGYQVVSFLICDCLQSIVLKLDLDVHLIYMWFRFKTQMFLRDVFMSLCYFPPSPLVVHINGYPFLNFKQWTIFFLLSYFKNPILQDPSMMNEIYFIAKGSILVWIMLPSFCMGVLLIATRGHVVQVRDLSTFDDIKDMFFTAGNITVTSEHAINIRK